MRGPDRWSAAVVVAVLALACGSGKRSPTDQPPAPVTAPWTRAEWLTTVEGFIAHPETMPRLSDPATRAVFQRLASTPSWKTFEGAMVERDVVEFERFATVAKQVHRILAAKVAMDELVLFQLYVNEVTLASIKAGAAFLDGLPAADRPVRQRGLERMQYGAALGVCGLMYFALDASDPYRAMVITTLTQPASYAQHSREGLQLILATLDQRLLPSVRPALQQPYREVRAVVAAAYDQRAAPRSRTRTTYEGVGPPDLDLARAMTVVSITGGFSVAASPGGVAKRVEIDQADGTTLVQHWIESRDGEATFEAICMDGLPEAQIVAGFAKRGFVAQASPHPGAWLTANIDGVEARMRVVTIGDRGCAASVEGPVGQVTAARAEAYLLSLQPVSAARGGG